MMRRPDRTYAKGFYQNAPSRSGGSPFAPPSPEAAGMGTKTPRCSECHARIVWIVMAKTRKRMPCNAEQRYGDGRRHLVVRVDVDGEILGRLITKAGPDVLGFEPHWGSCPARQQFKPQGSGRSAQTDLFGGAE